MNRWIIFAGMIVAVVLLFQFNSGKIATEDIFGMMEVQIKDSGELSDERGDEEDEEMADEDGLESQPKADGYFQALTGQNFYDKIFKKAENDEPFQSHVYGVILPSNLAISKDIAEFFVRLKETQDIKTFIIISENHSQTGDYNISSCRYGYETPFGNLEPDLDILDILEMDISFEGFGAERSFRALAPFIKRQFPEARIVSIVIKDFEEDANLRALAEELADISDEETLVVISTLFSQGSSKQTALFHDELSINVIENFDQTGILQMDVDSRPSMTVLLNYLELIDAKKADIQKHIVKGSTSHFLVTFHEGEPISEDRDLTIMAFGDMMPGRYVRTLMNQYGKDYIFENIEGYERRFFEGADVVFGNLEGPIKGAGRSGGTSMVFAFNEDIAPFLKEYGFNLLSLANNHAVDQGWDGRDTTISALEGSGIGWCGHPSEADPNSVYYGKVGDKSFAFICFHDVTFKLDDAAAVELIKDVRPNVDYLVVSIHWGYEYKHWPDRGSQISPGRAFIDAGADFVIGHHPHVVQTFEEYNGKFIFYSLGNFVFDQNWSQMTQEELAIGIVLDDTDEDEGFSTKVYLFPMKSESSQSRLMTTDEYNSWIERFIGYGEYSDAVKGKIRSGMIEIGH